MKKILFLMAGIAACLHLMAQNHEPMYFAGPSSFSGVFMGIEASQENKSDTIRFALKTNTTGDITMPAVSFNAMRLTIPSFTIHDATFDFDATTFSSVFTPEQPISETITVDGTEKKISGTLHEAAYVHADKTFSLKLTYTYGSMPGYITYVINAAYVVPAGIDIPTADRTAPATLTDLYGRRVEKHSQREGIYLLDGKKVFGSPAALLR